MLKTPLILTRKKLHKKNRIKITGIIVAIITAEKKILEYKLQVRAIPAECIFINSLKLPEKFMIIAGMC